MSKNVSFITNLFLFKNLLLILLFSGTTTYSVAQDNRTQAAPPVRVVEPDKKTDTAHAAILDTERFEIGGYAGALSVEDFNTNIVVGLSAIYHLNTHWYAQLNYGRSDVSRATFEDVAGGDFLADEDRDFSYLTLAAGYRLLHGRSFFNTTGKYGSSLHLVAGAGSTSFAGDSNTSLLLGVSYRIIRTDWLSINIDYRNHVVYRDFLNENKQTFNNEVIFGLNYFF